MKYVLVFLVGVLMAASAPQSADAQFGRLKERAKNRAKERLNEHAERKVDQAVDKVVDASVARTEGMLTDWVSGAFAGDAKVSDDGVLSRKGKDDVKLEPNKTGPETADHIHYLEVTTVSVPGIPSFSGATTVSENYLHQNRSAADDASTLTVLDLAGERMLIGDHKAETYWEQTFAETAEMVSSAMDQMATGPASTTDPNAEELDLEFSMDVDDTGIVENVNGIQGHKFVYVMEVKVSAEDESSNEKLASKFYTVSETWIGRDLAGFKTYTDFSKLTIEKMGMHAQAEEMGNKMQGLAFMDARIGDSMKKMGEEMAKAPGMPIKSVTYMVMVPEDEELDLEAVLSGTSSSDPNAMMAQGNVSEQSVVLVTTTYLSNWSTNAFDADRLEIPSSYKQIESPMKAMMKSMNDQR